MSAATVKKINVEEKKKMIQDLKGSVWPSTAKEFVPSGKDIAVITFKKNVGTNVSFNVTSLYEYMETV